MKRNKTEPAKIEFDTPNTDAKNKKQKKKGCGCGCGGCLITLAVVCVLFVGAATGGAFWAWGKFVQPSTGVTLVQALQLVGGLYGGKEDEIVTNPYDPEQDLQAFYTNFKSKTYIDASVELSLGELMSGAILPAQSDPDAQIAPTVSGQNAVVRATRDGYVALSELPEQDSEQSQTEQSAAMREFLLALKFDFSALKSYQGGSNILEISDKQFAAVLNEAFRILGEHADQIVADPQTAGLASAAFANLQIKQVIVSCPDPTAPEQTELKLTIACHVRELVKSAIRQLAADVPQLENGFVQGLIGAATLLLPKTLYVSAAAYPLDANAQARVEINAMDAEKMDHAFRLIDGLANRQTGDMMRTVNAQINGVIDKIAAFLPIAFVDSGMDTKPVEAMIGMMGLKGTVSESEFLYMIRDVNVRANDPETAAALQLDKYTAAARDEAVGQLIGALGDKYGIDNSDGALTPDNLYVKLSTMTQDQAMLDRMDLRRLNYTDPQYDASAHELATEYLALAGLVNSYYVDHAQTAGNLRALAYNVSYDPAQEKLSLLLGAELASLVPTDNEIARHLAAQILPAQLYIEIDIYLADPNRQATLHMNGMSVEESADTLATIAKTMRAFGFGGDMSYEGLIVRLDENIRGALERLEAQVGKIRFTQEKCYLPSVFEIVSNLPQMNPQGEDKMPAERIYPVFRQAYAYQPDASDLNMSEQTNAARFVADLQSDYYIAQGTLDPDDGKALVGQIKGLKDTFADHLDKDAMVRDTRAIDELKPVLPEDEMGYLVQENAELGDAVGFLREMRVIGSYIRESANDTTIDLYLSGDIALGQSSDTGVSYDGLMPRNVYVHVRIDVRAMQQKIRDRAAGVEPNAQPCVAYVVDGMNEAQTDDFLILVRRLSQKQIDRDQIATRLDEKIVDTMGSLNGGSNEIEITYRAGGMVLETTLFGLAVDQLYKDAPQDVQAPSAQRLRELLVLLNSYSDGLDASNISDLQGVADEINGKYALTQAYRLTAGAQDLPLDEQIARIARNYDQAIDGALLASGDATADEQTLKPRIDQGELAALLQDKVRVQTSGLRDVTLIAAYLNASDPIGLVDRLELRFTASVDTAGANGASDARYGALMPQKVVLRATVDLDRMSDASQSVCTAISINEMRGDGSGDQQSDDMTLFVNVFSRVSSNRPDLQQLNADASGKVRDNMKAVSNGTHIEYEPQTVVLDSVYGIALQEIYGDVQTDRPSAAEFRSMTRALWNADVVQSESQPYRQEEKISAERHYKVESMTLYGEVTDRSIAGTILAGENAEGAQQNMSDKFGVGKDDLDYDRVMLATRDDLIAQACFAGIRDLLVDYTARNATGAAKDDYLILTTRVIMQKPQGQSGLLRPNTMLPMQMQATIAMNLTKLRAGYAPDADGKQAQATFVLYNAMEDADVRTMQNVIRAIRAKDAGGATGEAQDLFGTGLAYELESHLLKMAVFPGMTVGGQQIAGATLGAMLQYAIADPDGGIVCTGVGEMSGLDQPYYGYLRFRMGVTP